MPDDFTIAFLGPEFHDRNGQSWTRYRYSVTIPVRLASSPRLVWPEGIRVNSPVAGISFVSKQKKRVPAYYGGSRNRQANWYFELQSDAIPPSWVCLADDRVRSHEYKSNFAETTL